MLDPSLTEEPLQFGEGSRLFGILTLSTSAPHKSELPVFVFLSAGLLHRVGPYRLHVRLARALALIGFHSLRVDLGGRGDSLRRTGLTDEQSVAADFEEIMDVLDAHLGRLPFVLVGLCSGANNAIRLAFKEPRVVGMVLLDPVCFKDSEFEARAAFQKYANPDRYVGWLQRRLKARTNVREEGPDDDEIDMLGFGNDPDREQTRAAFASICEREGRALSVFTRAALDYYNQQGQLGRVLEVDGYQRFCTELFWPQADHTYALEMHRSRLMEEIKTWAAGFVEREIVSMNKPSQPNPLKVGS